MLLLLIVLISFILQLFLPWYIIAVVAFGLAFWKAVGGKHAFWSGFGALFLLWAIAALVQSIPNEHLLANRVGQMLMLPPWRFNWLVVLFITGVTGGLAAGFSALAGFYMRRATLK